MKEFLSLTPYPWYGDLITFVVILAYVIYTIVKIWQLVDNSHRYTMGKGSYISISKGLKETYFDRQTHFTLYDLIRLFFIIPSVIAGVFLLLLKAGAWNLFPFLRKVLGFKLFRIERKKEDDNKVDAK